MKAKTTNLTRGFARVALRCGVAAVLVISATTSTAFSPTETLVVRPKGTVTWSTLVELDRALADVPKRRTVAKPYIAEPPPRYVGSSLRESSIAKPGTSRGNNPKSEASTSLKIQRPTGHAGRASILASFSALRDDGILIPPDTNGAVGPDHVMTMLNTAVRIQSKSGSSVVPDVSLAGFWALLAPESLADPRLVYDSSVGRWYATVIANFRSPASAVFLAVSASSDPTGVWSFYAIEADTSGLLWADFPDIGYSSKWLALTANMETVVGNNFSGVGMWVIDKVDVLAGDPLNVTRFAPGFDAVGGGGAFTLRPCRTFDAEATLYLADNSGLRDPADNRQLIRLSRITEAVDGGPVWSVVPGSWFAGSGLFRVPTNFRFGQIPASQRGSRELIQTNGPRMLSAVFRNGHIWCTHSGGMPPTGPVTRSSIFWYELDPLAMPDPVVQSGVIDGGAEAHHFFPSLAVNASNDMAVGFSRSDPTRFAEGAVTGRRASDPPGIVAPITTIRSGKGVYEKDFNTGRVRWGDYSSTEVDPVDDATFWTIQEYVADAIGPNENDQRWGTWWASVAGFDSVGACCDGEGACLGNLDYAACAALDATIHADEDCDDFQCPVLRTTCAGAAELTCNSSVTIDNRGISNPADPVLGCGFAVPYDGTVWFKFVATDVSARLSTCGSVAQDSALAVYDGDCTKLTEIACSEDDCGLKGFLNDLTVENLTPGETYFIQMSVFTPSDRGFYTLELSCPGCREALPPEPDPFLTDAGHGTKNRYVSFLDVNADRRVAYRLKFLNMPAGYEAFEGETMWVGPPALLTESPGNLFPFQAPGVETFQAALLQCTPRFKDWSRLGVVHVTHPLIVPGAFYAFQAIGDHCATDSEDGFSAELQVATSRWGDIAGTCASPSCAPPDGSVDIPDVLAILRKFVAAPGAPIKARSDLNPAFPDRLINIDDALAAVQGFAGLRYPFAPPPHPCP